MDRNWLTRELKSNGELPGPDGQYSTKQMTRVVFGGKKEREAKDSRHQMQIDEAAMMKNERDLQEGKLGLISHYGEALADVMTQLVQFVKQSKLSAHEKKDAMKILREVKLNPRKIVEFEK